MIAKKLKKVQTCFSGCGLIFDGKLRLIYYIKQNALYVLAFWHQGFDIAGSFADSVFSARGIGDYIQKFSKYYQLLIYGGVFCLLIKKRKEKYPIEKYVLLIGAFGGFLFSLIWEAKPRYVFPYFMFMFPYAAMMLSNLSAHFRKKEISHERNGKWIESFNLKYESEQE